MNVASILAATKKHPIGVASAVCCLICAFLLYYRAGLIDEEQTAFDAKSVEALNIATNIRNSANLPEQLAEIEAMSKEFEGRLVRAGQLAVNLQYFYKLEAENEVKLLDLRPGNVAGKGGKSLYVGIPYAVAVQGGYKQVLAFLQRLEAGRHFCRFNNVNLTKASSDSRSDQITLTLSIELLGTP